MFYYVANCIEKSVKETHKGDISEVFDLSNNEWTVKYNADIELLNHDLDGIIQVFHSYEDAAKFAGLEIANSHDLNLNVFIHIFSYGNENSGALMFDRFKNEFCGDVLLFVSHLCDIDLAKWNKYFNNRA